MKTQSFVLSRIRGVDLRYQVSPDSASDIQDMRWTLNDSWTSCGGFRPVTVPSIGYFPWSTMSANILPEFLTPKAEVSEPGGLLGGAVGSASGTGASSNNAKIESLHWFSQHNGARQWLIWEDSDGRLQRFRGSTPDEPYVSLTDRDGNTWNGTDRSRYVRRTPAAGTQGTVWGGRIYMINGNDEPIVFDGRVTATAGYRRSPTPPSAELVFRDFDDEETSYWLGTKLRNQGLGSSYPFDTGDGDGKLCGYKYRVTYVNRRGQESAMSESSNIVQFECGDGGKKRFVKLIIPTGNTETVARKIYRTRDIYDEFGQPTDRDYGYNFYLVKEVQDNITTVIEDGVSDSNLGSLSDPEDFGPWPRQAKFMSSFKNTMFLAGMPNNQIRFSAPGMPEVFPMNNLFDISEGDGGDVTGMYPTKNALVVFKRRGVYLIKGDPVNGFYVQTLTKDIGCVAADSLAEVPGLGLVFLSESGIFVLEGALENTGTPTGITEMSVPIREWFDGLSDAALAGAVGIVYHRDREFWLCVPNLGEVENTVVFVFHYAVGAWSRRFSVPVNCAVETKDHRGYLFFGSGDAGARPGIHVYTHSEVRKGVYWGLSDFEELSDESLSGSLIVTPKYHTSPLSFGSVYRSIQPAYVNAYCVARGDIDLGLNVGVNRSLSRSFLQDKVKNQTDLMRPQDVYTPTLAYDSTTVWGNYQPMPFRFDVSVMHESLVTEMQMNFSSATPRNPHIELVGYDLEAKLGAQREIRILTDALSVDRR